ncbi:transposase [Roseovarius sp.]|uniref:transposase n=1 Tax=Roseovarius sp. TaxID=1486281 RepID=UPI003561BB09
MITFPLGDLRRMKGCSSRNVQGEFPALGKRHWGRHFRARGFFCAAAGSITEDLVLKYLEEHGRDATGASRQGAPPR